MLKTSFFLLLTLPWLYSCTSEILKVHSDYLSHENLASYHVGTPDPRLNCPPVGQRLIISWLLPKDYANYSDLYLHLQIRFYDQQQEERWIPIHKRKGDYVFCLINEAYLTRGGIATYQVELKSGEICLDQWTHVLWADWIPLKCAPDQAEHGEEPLSELPYSLEELDTDF